MLTIGAGGKCRFPLLSGKPLEDHCIPMLWDFVFILPLVLMLYPLFS